MENLFRGVSGASDRDAHVIQACKVGNTLLARLREEGSIDALEEIWELQQQCQGFSKGGNLRAGFEAMTAVIELSRRTDRAIGVAVREGQLEGIIRSNTHNTEALPSPSRWWGRGNTRQEMIGITDGVSEEDFERALQAAKAEGNMARRNVLRHVREAEQTPDWIPQATDHSRAAAGRRKELIRNMAAQNMSSYQMAERIGTLAGTIRGIARANRIEIPADKIMGKTRVPNSGRIMEEAANALAGVAMSLELLDPASVDSALAPGWLASITSSVKTINQVVKSVREETL